MNLPTELARMTAFFQLRTVAMAMGADPDSVDADSLTLSISPASLLPAPVPANDGGARDNRCASPLTPNGSDHGLVLEGEGL
ncbi:MAG: hypothetical protein EON59_00715 [Alphaproteobacteria bacterium]|nr:MAG: hypothetical protein EON59_00715 [Alphaproteobacteria bacterium]